MNRISLALSLVAHAGLLGAIALASEHLATPEAAGGSGPAGLWVSLVARAPSGATATPISPPSVRPASAAPRRPSAGSARPPTPSPGLDASAVDGLAASAALVDAGEGSSSTSASAPGGGPPDWPGAGQVDRAARPRWPIRPHYPSRARREGREATVVVEAWIDEAGDVAHASVVRSGGPDFDASARRAVTRSAFRPARLGGRDVPSRLALRIHFDLYD